MADKKTSIKTLVTIAVVGLLGIAIGILANRFMQALKPKNNTEANASEYSGIYLFIRSKPEHPYVSLGVVQTSTLTNEVQGSHGKVSLGEIINRSVETQVTQINFESRLKEMVEIAKKQKPDIQGLIFNDDLSQCEEIKFK